MRFQRACLVTGAAGVVSIYFIWDQLRFRCDKVFDESALLSIVDEIQHADMCRDGVNEHMLLMKFTRVMVPAAEVE